jgi:nucleoid-associated protein YgaU
MRKHGVSQLALAGVVVLLFAAVTLPAQSLLDNDYYKQAKDLLAKSQSALDAGDYDGAAQYAKQAQDALAKSDDYVATMTQFYRANGMLSVANDRIAYAKSIQADVNYKTQYDTAVTAVAAAKTALDAKSYDASITSSQAAIAALKDIAPKVAEAPKAAPAGPPPLPQYYTVRLILPKRDCFWRIAAYPFVYNNPWKWRILYEANKNVIEDPNNPDLIEVDMRFVIPPIAGETRSGDYDPSKEYPTAPAAK